MKVAYYTDCDRMIHVKMQNIIYDLYPGEVIKVDDKVQNDIIYIFTERNIKKSFLSTAVLFLKKIIVNLFNIFIMNIPEKLFKRVEPYTISAVYKIKDQAINLKYISSELSESLEVIEKPKLIINGETVPLNIKPDINSIKEQFVNYCFDIITLLIYGVLPIFLIFVFSGLFFFALAGLFVFACFDNCSFYFYYFKRAQQDKDFIF